MVPLKKTSVTDKERSQPNMSLMYAREVRSNTPLKRCSLKIRGVCFSSDEFSLKVILTPLFSIPNTSFAQLQKIPESF
jgi:hypothetical protein